MSKKQDPPDWVTREPDPPKKRTRYISAKRAAEEIAALDGKTSEEMGEEFQGTMAEYERYLICRDQALRELPADATLEDLEDLTSDFEQQYDLDDLGMGMDRPSLKLERPSPPRKCQHRWRVR